MMYTLDKLDNTVLFLLVAHINIHAVDGMASAGMTLLRIQEVIRGVA